jgi:hypothetical protein
MLKLDLNPAPKALRVFAWATLILFPLLGGVFSGWQWQWIVAFAVVGVVQFIAEQLGQAVLTRLLWIVLAPVSFVVGMVVSHVLLGVIFYVVMTPIGLVFRLIGRDAMKRRPDRTLASYWTERSATRAPSSYFRLY